MDVILWLKLDSTWEKSPGSKMKSAVEWRVFLILWIAQKRSGSMHSYLFHNKRNVRQIYN